MKLGFGLHMGWSIEGAIGSEYKIDASYLSPNVNIASRLEAATKQYGVPLLISSDLYRNFSEEIQSFCRKIDVVTLKGSAIPLGLYTIDIDVEDLPPEKNHNLIDKNAIFDKHRMKKEAIQNFYDKKEFKSKEIFCADKDIKLLMRYFEGQIKSNEKFHLGLNCYLSGDWEEAKKYFTDFLLERINDGPASALIDFMKKYNWIKPEGWPGYRELIEK